MFTANKTVDQVLSVFRKTIEELTKVEDNHTIAAVEKQASVEAIQKDIAAHKAEAAYAQATRTKLSAIFN